MRSPILILLLLVMNTPRSGAVQFYCRGESCKTDTFHRVTWSADGNILQFYLPPFQYGQQISFRTFFHRAAWSSPASDYQLTWGDKTFELADVVKIKVEKSGFFCILRKDGTPLRESDEVKPTVNPSKIRSGKCILMSEYLSESPAFVGIGTQHSFDAPPQFALYSFGNEDGGARSDLAIRGPFNGDLTQTSVKIDRHNPEIVSESPSQALILVDSDLHDKDPHLDQLQLGRTVLRVTSGAESDSLNIDLYAQKSVLTPLGQSGKGNLQIQFVGFPHIPPSRLAYVFNPNFSVDVATSSTIKRYKPREIKRLRQLPRETNPLYAPDHLVSWEKAYRVDFSDKLWKPDRAVYQIDIPIKVKNAAAWKSSVLQGSTLLALPEPARVKTSVLAEIERWQSLNHISVTTEVQQQIANQFIELSNNNLLPESWLPFSREVPSFNDFVRSLTSMYLYVLRDTPSGKKLKPLTLISFPVPEQTKPPVKIIATITVKLVEFLDETFFSNLRNYGLFDVVSDPVGAQFLETGDTTNRPVGLKVGEHTFDFAFPDFKTCTCRLRVENAGLGWMHCDLGTEKAPPKCTVGGATQLQTGQP